MATKTVTLHNLHTGELCYGDIVTTQGLRVLLETPPRMYSHGFGRGVGRAIDRRYTVWAYDGRITNIADVAHYVGSLATGPNRDRWVIQGNDLATWSVERVMSEAALSTLPARVRYTVHADSAPGTGASTQDSGKVTA